jgi:drug/metabolite transporter (DMT)-like permease
MTLLPQIVYLLCAVTSFTCMVLLLRGYRRTKVSLLLWSGWSFLAFTISNLILFVDLVLMGPEHDLWVWRTVPTLIGVLLLLYGLIRTNTEV